MSIPSLSAISYKTWLLFMAGPALFLLAIVAVSIFFSLRAVPETDIPARVTALAPHILLGVLVGLAAFLTCFTPQVIAAWQPPVPGRVVTDIVIGVLVGALLAISYIYWLAPLLEFLQRTVGDFVPPGSILPTVSSTIGLFFIANVLLAPLVEETLYRGIAIPLFSTHFGMFWAIVLSCLLFGLLHWAGGFWYMLLTGVVAGGIFAALFYWSGSVLAPFAAHFALNLIEFIYAWRIHDRAL